MVRVDALALVGEYSQALGALWPGVGTETVPEAGFKTCGAYDTL